VIIANNPQRYGFLGEQATPFEFEKVAIGRSVKLSSIAAALKMSLQTLKELNPELTQVATPRDYPDYQLKVPVGSALPLSNQLARLPDATFSSARTYRVRRGDTLGGVAQRFGVSATKLARVNGLALRASLKPNATLNIPAKTERTGVPASAGASVRYRVRKGDTWSGISRKTGVSIARLRSINGLSSQARLRVGQTLALANRQASTQGAPLRLVQSATRSPVSTVNGARHKVVHQVRKGESVGLIAKRYRTNVKALRQWNPTLATLLYPGQRLTIFTSD
jgi:membrane-bound lytic murein transglycosylase D